MTHKIPHINASDKDVSSNRERASMKLVYRWIIVAVMTAVIGINIWVPTPKALRQFWAVDRCLDRGRAWDDDSAICRYR